MAILRLFRACRVPARIACLALFLAGSNYCLLSGWSGNAAMACLSLPTHAAPRCHHCTPSSKSESQRPSCCPAPVVTPHAPAIDRDGLATPLSSDLFTAVVSASPLPAVMWRGHRPLEVGRPPTRLVSAPLPARAPPLA